ncbi:hypothetical protein D3C80_1645680 [compost metagenome]
MHQDAVDRDVGIQLRNSFQYIVLAYVCRQTVLQGTDADLLGPQQFIAHINLAGRVFTDKQHGQGRVDLLSRQDLNLFSNLLENLGCDGFAVDFAGKCGDGADQKSHRCLDCMGTMRSSRRRCTPMTHHRPAG